MSTTLPAWILWLLDKLVSSAYRESLLGDLLEQRAQGRSKAWFTRQVVWAVVASTVADLRAAYGVMLMIATFVGLSAAAALGTIKTAPGLEAFDALLPALGAGWLVGRIGGVSTGIVLVGLVAIREVPPLYAAVMQFLDHFGGLWFITDHAMRALPDSLALAALGILASALLGTRPRHDPPMPAPTGA